MGKENLFADSIMLFFIMVTGAAQAAQLLGVFFHAPVSRCVMVFGALALLSAVAVLILEAFRRRAGGRALHAAGRSGSGGAVFSLGEKLLLALFVLLAASQIFFLLTAGRAYAQGDMTVETALSFLRTDAVYRVNPMTGRAYGEGLPTRLEILCLPMLYASLAAIFHIQPYVLILYVIPAVILLCSYMAYSCLAQGLFPEERWKRLGFLAMAALIFWIGCSSYGMDGFGLLFTGWRGTTIRNTILIPYTFSLCLRRKYLYLPLCLLAEACILWTLYGLGACALVIAGMALAGLAVRWQSGEDRMTPGVRSQVWGGKGGGV